MNTAPWLSCLCWMINLYGVQLSYAAALSPQHSHPVSQDNSDRDPFHAPVIKPCAPLPALMQQGKLVGIIGDSVTRSAWVLGASGNGQKIVIDWQVENSGWYVAAITANKIEFVNDSAICDDSQHYFLNWATANKNSQ